MIFTRTAKASSSGIFCRPTGKFRIPTKDRKISTETNLKQDDGRHEREALTVADLFVIDRVGLADLVEGVFLVLLLEEAMSDVGPLDVPVDDVLSRRVLIM